MNKQAAQENNNAQKDVNDQERFGSYHGRDYHK